jgi:hypothetical protein
VALDKKAMRPPDPISGIKALFFDNSADSNALLNNAIDVFLGLGLRPGEQRIFISYRASDGTAIAKDLHARLTAAGFHPWLDEAKDVLNPGDDVQKKIMDGLKPAALVLMVDTRDAPSSPWIKLEIEAALGALLPILPIVEGRAITRFIPLQGLLRFVPAMAHAPGSALTDAEWENVRSEIEQLLLETYRRRMRTITHAEQIFAQYGFKWSTIDDPKRIFQCQRSRPRLPTLSVLTHCSIYDATYLPPLRVYKEYLNSFPGIAQITYKLCVYDGDQVLADPELQTIGEDLPDLTFILAHHNELPVILSGF